MVIHPSDLPAGIGVQISTYRSVALIVDRAGARQPALHRQLTRPAGGAVRQLSAAASDRSPGPGLCHGSASSWVPLVSSAAWARAALDE